MPELHRHLAPVDLAGEFRLENGRIAFAFGKYCGRRLAEVAEEHPDSLRRMLTADFLPDVRRLVRQVPHRFAPAYCGLVRSLRSRTRPLRRRGAEDAAPAAFFILREPETPKGLHRWKVAT